MRVIGRLGVTCVAWSLGALPAGCAQILGLETPGVAGDSSDGDSDGDGDVDAGGTPDDDASPGGDAMPSCAAATPVFDDTNYGPPVVPRRLAVGDLNQDGRDDLLVASQPADRTVLVYFNNQTPTFGSPEMLSAPMECSGILQLAVADVNVDGRGDIVGVATCGDETALVIWRQLATPAGSFGAPQIVPGNDTHLGEASVGNTVIVADLSPATGPDVVFVGSGVGGVVYFRHDPVTAGSFLPAVTIAAAHSGPLAVADVDGDGLRDLIFSEMSNAPELLWSPQNALDPGSFLAARALTTTDGATALATGDLGGSAALDLAIGTDSGVDVRVQAGAALTQGPLITGGNGTLVRIAALDDLGNALITAEVIAMPCPGEPGVFRSPGVAPPWVSPQLHDLVTGDFDDDGKTDLAVVTLPASQLTVYRQP